MFDYHMHTKISFDSTEEPIEMIRAAEKLGLKEICFTDHCDHNADLHGKHDIFTPEEYAEAYDTVDSDSVKVRRGIEFGMTHWNKEVGEEILSARDYDFVIGSSHYAGDRDPYYPEFWEGINLDQAVTIYLTNILECIKIHDNFDVLGHLTYVCKSTYNPLHKTVPYRDYADLSDEIMKILVAKGKGMEINTSGVDRAGDFLPSLDYLKRFRELGGEIITIGSDAHERTRVGQYAKEAMAMAKEAFDYVCTFEKRKPIFHKL